MIGVRAGDRCPGCGGLCTPDMEHLDWCRYQGANALELLPPRLGLVPKHFRSALQKLKRDRWLGAKEIGLAGNTQGALADRHVAETRWAKDPHRRLVSRLSPLGELYINTHLKGDK